MTPDLLTILKDAWTLFRRDRDLLLRIAGAFLFLPAFALALFVPPWPAPDAAIADPQAKAQAWIDALSTWFAANGGVSLAAYLVMYFGLAMILVMYLDARRPTVAEALGRALRIFPRFLLAMVLVSVPAGIGVIALLVVPGLYVLGRTMLVGPVLIAERPGGAWAAIARGWMLTRGHGLKLMALAAFGYLTGAILAAPFTQFDAWIRTSAPNPVALAIVDAAGAGVAMLTGLATALIAVAAYRRLAR